MQFSETFEFKTRNSVRPIVAFAIFFIGFLRPKNLPKWYNGER